MKSSIVAFAAAFAILAAGCGAADSNQTPLGPATGVQTRTSPQTFGAALSRVQNAQSGEVAVNADSASISPDIRPAATYCNQTGGRVYFRIPEYNTNSSKPLVLAGRAPFCQYTMTTSYGNSRIHILLTTLYSTKPSLAALAYINAPPIGSCNGNPASCYCSLLGASDQFGGASGAGGSWVNLKSEDQDLEACIFPDGSSIDSWGLTYHADGIIRGIDLTKVMRYKYTGDGKAVH